jgi:hypothetical protein
MKSRTWMWTAVVYLLATIALTIGLAAQDNPSQNNDHRHHRYKFIDIGTFGGPTSGVPTSFVNEIGNRVISDEGTVGGVSDTAEADPLCLFDDCFIPNAGAW